MVDFKMKPRLLIKDGQAMTTSIAIAEHFEKAHSVVLRAIRNLECSDEFARCNFALVNETMNYVDSQGVAQEKMTSRTSHYLITRDGFVFLAMGFTGKLAAIFKEAYIAAFNAMESALATQRCNYRVAELDEQLDGFQAWFDDFRKSVRQIATEAYNQNYQEVLAETAKLSLQSIAARLKLPELGSLDWKGCTLSEHYMAIFFAVGENKIDATLLWLLLSAHSVTFGKAERITAVDLLRESEGRLHSIQTIYRSRARLIAAGFLKQRLESGWWLIDREFLQERLNEVQFAAFLQHHDDEWLTIKGGDKNQRLEKFIKSLSEEAAMSSLAMTHRAPKSIQ